MAVLGEMVRAACNKRRSLADLARVGGDVGSVADRQSGWEWQGSQSGQGATELVFPRPTLGQMQGEAARRAGEATCRAGESSGEGEEPPPEGLGGQHRLAQTDARGPASEVVGHHLYGQPGGVGWEAARGEMVEPEPYLRSRMAFSISARRRWSASSARVSGSVPSIGVKARHPF